jgi:probable phosphoglycerate mutase
VAPIALLIRHAHTPSNGVSLTGRSPDVHLSDRGQRELTRLQQQLAGITIDAIYSSPLARALETAAALCVDRAISVEVIDDLNEMDFGDWTGRSFEQLEADPNWREFNTRRSSAPVPNGERALEVQRRVVDVLAHLAARHRRGGVIAAVSHAEVIRSAVLSYGGRSLDEFHRATIETGSVSAVCLSSPPRVLFTNAIDRCDLAAGASPDTNPCAVSVVDWLGMAHRFSND